MNTGTNSTRKRGLINIVLLSFTLLLSAGVSALRVNSGDTVAPAEGSVSTEGATLTEGATSTEGSSPLAEGSTPPAEGSASEKQAEVSVRKKQTEGAGKKAVPSEFTRVLWTDLIPQDDLEALLSPPDYLSSIVDGSPQDQIGAVAGNSDDRYQQALVSTRVVESMDGEAIKIPGFVVPIEFDDDQIITQFFLVPYFGACIHEPPPPPNQIIFVDYPKGLTLTALYDPFWISGVLKTSVIDNGLATAAYTMDMYRYEAYTEEYAED